MTLSIDIPEAAGVDERFVKEALAATLYYNGKLSAKQAREMLGMTRRAFEEMLPLYGYTILVDSPENLEIERSA
jgi:predicted HTH domain antitoxin